MIALSSACMIAGITSNRLLLGRGFARKSVSSFGTSSLLDEYIFGKYLRMIRKAANSAPPIAALSTSAVMNVYDTVRLSVISVRLSILCQTRSTNLGSLVRGLARIGSVGAHDELSGRSTLSVA